jgi:hypothetical protein
MSSVQQEFSEGQLKELKELKELQELQELEGLQELEELQELQEDSLIQEEEDLLEDLAAFNAELESADVKPSISSVASSETSSLFLKKKDEITLDEKQSFSSNETKGKKCLSFNVGSCKNGYDCPFDHAHFTVEEKEKLAKRPCNNKNCNGERCVFLHLKESTNSPKSSTCEEKSSFQPKRRCDTMQTTGKCKFGDGCHFNHDLCNFYRPNKGNSCTNGEKCNFIHSDLKTSASPTAEAKSSTFQPSGISCQFGKKCKYRDTTCKFTHPAVEPVQSSNQAAPKQINKSPQVPCVHFQKGNCKKGVECTFLHDGVRPVHSSKPVVQSSSEELKLQLQIAELKLQLAQQASGQSRQQSEQVPLKSFSHLNGGGGGFQRKDNTRK